MTWILALLTSVPASAPTPVLLPPRASSAGPRHERLHVDTDADGDVWARGRTYKARFGLDGATYVPFLGSCAPRNYPLALALADVRAGDVVLPLEPAGSIARDGDRVTIDHGVVDEVYELALDGVEQTFVIEERPAAGDLRLVVRATTELARAERDDGFVFWNELGGVHVGRAFLRGADGVRTPVASRLVEDGFEIVVPAEELARAAFPLVVDPILTTFAVDTTPADTLDTDCSWDRTSELLLVVMDEVFSANDHDTYCELVDLAGVQVNSAYVDSSTEDWRHPRCANLDIFEQFMVVASVRNFGLVTDAVILGRAIDADSLVFDPKFRIDGAAPGDHILPDIAADPSLSLGSTYYVTWTLDDGSGVYLGVWRAVNTSSALVSNVMGGFASAIPPDLVVARSNAGGDWLVVGQVASGTDVELQAVEIDRFTNMPGPAIVLTPVPGDYSNVAVSSRNAADEWVVAFQDTTSNNDVRCILLDGTTVLDDEVLAALENNPAAAEDQRMPSIETDGQQFLVAYAESVGGNPNDFDVKLTELHVSNGQLGVTEAHVGAPSTTGRELRPAVTSAWVSGGAEASFAFSWDREQPNNTRNVFAGYFTGRVGGPVTPFCSGDGTGTACPCGNAGGAGRGCANASNATGAQLTSSGAARVSTDTLVLQASGMPATTSCLFFQGTLRLNGGNGFTFGDGLRCVGGSVIRMSIQTAVAGVATYPSGAAAPISLTGAVPALTGGTFHYQAWYRDAAAFCTAGTFNLTNALSAVWLP